MSASDHSSSAGPPDKGAGEAARLHVAIVMDGNGRWAKRRGLPRTVGHQAGAEALKRIVQASQDLGIRWLTIFGFSTENWSRPVAEVAELMALPQRYFRSDLPRLEREGVRVRVIGREAGLSPDLLKICREAEARTAHNSSLFLTIAFNYGGQADIADAAQRFAEDVAAGRAKASDLTEAGVRAVSVHIRVAADRPDRASIARAMSLQLRALGSRLCRVCVPGRPVAGLFAGAPEGRHRRVSHAWRSPVRRRRRRGCPCRRLGALTGRTWP